MPANRAPLPELLADNIDKNIERIRVDLIGRGLTCEPLLDDLLDHVCCMIEEEMRSGGDFNASYDKVVGSIGEKRLPEIQHQTFLNLNKKFQRMKRFTYIAGLTGSFFALAGAFFKLMHWPGAGILISLGFLLVGVFFLPLYFILSYREQLEKPGLVYPFTGFITLFLVLAGSLFKIMHWPGAHIVLVAGVGVILIGFIPLFTVRVFQKDTGRRIHIAYLVMLVIGLSVVVLLSRVNIGKEAIDQYTRLSIENLQETEQIQAAIDGRMGTFAVIPVRLNTFLDQADELQRMTEQMREALIEQTGEAGLPIDQVERLDFRDAARDAILDNGKGAEFLKLVDDYRAGLMDEVSDPVFRSQIDFLLGFSGNTTVKTWNVVAHADVYGPMIIYYYDLTDFSRRIAYCAWLAVSSLH
jgi:hypothetical protein